ncbi:hypothetical protein LAZ67_X001373 [Cordylochernes scorpioides]|uniref:Zinc finger homeobox protein 4 n=1 Tax=Cordylochernes scorpioides TaxID=51811 RepID=A0ABY6LWH9_9ARAC|nr:hypothetical protein LAZ67_X001373 [Cordylochernes scorpioides]
MESFEASKMTPPEDVETFRGRIVYNADGSALILDDPADLEGADERGSSPPLVSLAHHVSCHEKVVHSYRVFSLHHDHPPPNPSNLPVSASVPIKPILMCFICKLSFSYSKSFIAHASGEHRLDLSDREMELFSHSCTSAIIQGLGKEKTPLLSFLEPIINHPSLRHYLPPSSKAMDNMNSESSSPEILSNKMLFNHKPLNCDDPLAPELEDLANIEKIAKAAAAAANSIDETMIPTTMGSMKICSQDEKNNLSLDIGESTPKLTSPSSHSPIPSTSSLLMGCPQHPDGKTNGIECPKCDMILGSSRTLGGHMNLLHSRNSCKTLKCPKCNWHYKYQETLEIHMKEKHPENEMNCIYCLSNQPHPRLSRGETYNCGYKPYRCEVCNYSTTTKGNLSIHMQSDKHINNVQEIQNGSLQPEHVLQPQNIPPNNVIPVDKKPSIANKPKAMWRCDVCNYETNVARNLRIHMTSEKHTHNIMVLEQNVKHMQQMSAFQAMADPLFQFHPGLLMPCDSQLQPEAALADMAYNHALLMMATQHQHQRVVNSGKLTPMLDIGAPDPTLRPEAYGESSNLFLCCICGVFSTDSIDLLHRHVQEDRTRQREDEVLVAMTGTFLCKLCSYKTNLKANFQLHCKTDKHLQRLQHVNHIKEGGPANEWKIKFSGVGNSVQVRCTCCNYYTNSIHKLQMHTASPQHDACSNIYLHLLALDATLSAEVKYYHCKFCTSNHRTKLHLILHVHSFQHLCNSEGREEPEPFAIKELKPNEKVIFEAEGEVHPEMPMHEENEAPKMKEEVKDEPNQEENKTDYLNNNNNNNKNEAKNHAIPCPLCQEKIKDYDKLEPHLMEVHQVNKEGVQRLLAIVEKPAWTPKPSQEIVEPKQEIADDAKQAAVNNTNNNNNNEDENEKPLEDLEEFSCPKCFKKFSFIEELFSHQNEQEHLDISHTSKGLSYHCWNKMCNQIFTSIPALQMHFREVHVKRPLLSVSDRHVYKYRCNQCSLAFKTLEKLNLHSQYHAIRAATKCVLCGRSFRTMAAVQKHVEAVHVDMTKEEMEQYRNSLVNNPLLSNSGSGVLAPDTLELLKKETIRDDNEEEAPALSANLERMDTYECGDNEAKDQQMHHHHQSQDQMNQDINKDQFFEDYLNSQTNAEEGYSDPNRKYKCHRCKVAYTRQCYLTSHNKTLQHRKGEKMTYPLEKYLDPNRPFKCEICKESFTQKNILLVHYNSVSHLHKVKMVQKESGHLNNNNSNASNSQNSMNQISSQNNTANMGFSSQAMNSESDKKPYKCNICKVSYSQASTLDIHVRSVLHQTRASKIHELALSGQYDPSTPLIERPENPSESEMMDHNKEFQFMNNIYKSLNNEEAHQAMNLSSQPPILFPLTKPLNSCQRCGVICGTQEALIQHQFYCPAQQMTLKPEANSFTGQDLSSSKIPTSMAMSHSAEEPMSTNKLEQALNGHQNLNEPPNISPMYMTRSKFVLPKTRFPIYKNLLEGFGFDVVMQFNEHHKKKPKVQEDKEEKNSNENNENNKSDKDSSSNKSANPAEKENKSNEENDNIKNDLPEINKSICDICGKDFSSIWVLKAHQEEIHKKIIPFEIIDKIASEFKTHFDSKLASQSAYNNQEENMMPENCSTPSETGTTNSPPQQANVPPTSSSASYFPQNPDMTPNQMAANQMAAAQMQFNQFLMSMGLGMGLPMGMNLPFAAAAAIHPSLIPVMIPSHMDPLVTSSFGHPLLTGSLEANFFATQQKLFQQQQQQQINQQQQKRARTRINDEQLKILRAYFDINNSPTEEQLIEMSEKSGLPLKVIKHWFRNTLFKERQRNKDSPYNFNNPPSTYLNLEEYEKTGEAKVIPINNNPEENKEEDKNSPKKTEAIPEVSVAPVTSEPQINSIKKEPVASIEKPQNEEASLNCSSPYNPTQPKMKLSTPSPISTSLSSGDESLRNKFIETPTHHFFPSSLPMPHIGSSITPTPPTSESPNSTGTPCSSGTTTPTTTMSSGKRANRTRFTDYQIKVLQEFFETNAYPKDDDLEYLSKLLCLSPRVIVVWFQNARQKARKVYENQPPPNEEDLRSQKSPGLTYQCRKCMQVFQRYYELIKHQKNSCYKDDMMANHLKPVPGEESNSALLAKLASESEKMNQPPVYRCDKCSLVFTRLDLWREHQIVHIMNPTLFPNINNNSPYIYPYEAQQPKSPMNMLKRKLSDDEDENKDLSDQPRDKRLRTTILPEQLDYLYQKYQIESNPSRKMLDAIAKEVGLKKRVVQVWFQNTRARERKGQFRAHQQVIHKRCPFCRALFKARSALESHLATRHADQYTKGEIIIDALPDGDCDSNSEAPSTSEDRLSSYNMASYSPSISQASMLPTDTESLNATMKRYYQDSLKKYIDEISIQNTPTSKDIRSLPTDLSLKMSKSPGKNDMKKEDTPLDLSKPLKMADLEKFSLSDVISLGDKEDSIADDAPSETYSESTDNMDGDDFFYETSPSPKTPGGAKRYRTQMSNMQLKVMKSIFNDYKTPSMAECEQLGREIGLPKRVIQVWFQNARAKEKKAKLVFAKTFGQEFIESTKLPEECKLCHVKYKFSATSVQDHIFSKEHIDVVRSQPDEELSRQRLKLESNGDKEDPLVFGGGYFPGPYLPTAAGVPCLVAGNTQIMSNKCEMPRPSISVAG